MKMTSAAALLALGLLAAPALAADANGTWAMQNGKVIVQLSDCGAGSICGKIVGLKEPISKIDGKPKVDRENPDLTLRKRPLIGLSIMHSMKAAGDGKWKGTIYNPDDGNTYAATVKLDGNTMKVQGCVLGLLCRTNIFVRAN